MKADPFAQLRLLDLQALDAALDRLAHRRRTLPELAEIARLDGLVEAGHDELVRARTEAGDLARQTRRYEDEIALVRARRTRNDERLASGAITASRQLEDLQHENASLTRRQGELEDRELEVMEQAEQVQAGLDALEGARAEHLAARVVAEQTRDPRVAGCPPCATAARCG